MAPMLRCAPPQISRMWTATAVKLGVATEADRALDSFAERLRREVVATQGVFALPTFVGAWSRRRPG
ncbi:hypothetical protein HAP47_0032465 [Bradyrhizobium sp. 41S5]|uniref:hypothetical protein n=1 Tax=Bradyrhizobium sp. 41S5 TaxID=1404443 RepID=UPI00156BAB28|nr:hypothetical protein [Bradyrhizobium sp. 41S5]UFX43886.1 hypothetical protein HAP47_0032465 [Bradyrhizobium sp. 41S5]